MGVPAEVVQYGVKSLIVDLGGNSISLLIVGLFFAGRMYTRALDLEALLKEVF